MSAAARPRARAGGPPAHRIDGDAGPVLVLVHGVGLDLHMWDELVPLLRTTCRVVRYDLIGHGATPPRDGELGLDDLAGQLHDLLAALALRQVTLVGFSLGVPVVLQAALRDPAPLARLILLSGVHARNPAQRDAVTARLHEARARGPGGIAAAALARWFTPAFSAARPDAVARVRERLAANDPRGFLPAYRLFAGTGVEFAGRLAALRLPTLVMTGEADPGSTPDMARGLAGEITDARLQIVPGMRHLLPIEGAREVAAAVAAFVHQRAAGNG